MAAAYPDWYFDPDFGLVGWDAWLEASPPEWKRREIGDWIAGLLDGPWQAPSRPVIVRPPWDYETRAAAFGEPYGVGIVYRFNNLTGAVYIDEVVDL